MSGAGVLVERSWARLAEIASQTAAGRTFGPKIDTRGWELLGMDSLGGPEGLVVLNELENGGGVLGLLEGLANLTVLEELRDAGHGMQVLLELALRDEEEHHEAD